MLEGTPSALAFSSAAPAKASSKQSFQFLYVNVDRRAGTPHCWQLSYDLKNQERTILGGAGRRGASGCMIDER